VFISYARATESVARLIAEALRGHGFDVWRDDELPPHRTYADVIEERIRAARAVVVVWSADAVKSQWVRAEADLALQQGTLVQLSLDGVLPPMPFNQIHCVDLAGWSGNTAAPGWRKITSAVAELLDQEAVASVNALPLPDKPSLAVLPFINLANDSDQDYFAAGMMDEVVTSLSRIHSLFVIASSATRSLKDQSLEPREIAQRLGVRYILEGSVRRANARVRISVKLTDARGGAQIWADRFEDTLEDVFALQDRVALSVAGVIEPSIHAAELRRISRGTLENLGSYDLYLRAAHLRATLRQKEVIQALELLDRALALEPDFAPALAQAAGCHSQLYFNRWTEDLDFHRTEGLRKAERAVRAGADDAAVLAQVASAVMELDHGIDRAIDLIERATTLNPGSAYAWFISGLLQLVQGNGDEAVEHLQRAARLDPISRLNEIARAHIGIGRALLGEFDEALRIFRAITYRTPRVQLFMPFVCAELGLWKEAREELRLYEQLTDIPPEALFAGMPVRPDHRAAVMEAIAKVRASEES
jgi:adenylate cyclase